MALNTLEGKKFYYELSNGSFSMPSHHYHNLFELYFLERGRCRYFIDDNSYDVEPGDIAFILPGTVHKTIYENNSRKRRVIYCSGYFVPGSVMPVISEMSAVYREPSIIPEVKKYISEIETEYKENNIFSQDKIRCFMHLLLILLAQHKNKIVSPPPQSSVISSIAAFLKDNVSSNLSLSETAEKYGFTPQYLSSLFKEKTGMGFHEYIHLLRMLKAEELLSSSVPFSISEVSEKCGFNDSNYFSFVFKKHFGMNPSAMKKQYKQTSIS